MKKLMTALLSVMLSLCVLSSALAGGLPGLGDVFGVDMPSLGKALKIPSVTDETLPDGSRVLTYQNITEQDYAAFSDYLLEFGCELQDYTADGAVFTFTLAKEGKTFTFIYDGEAGTAALNYPAGTNCEEFDYEGYVAEMEAAAAAEREAKLAACRTVGSTFTFGHYPQTASGTDSTPIEWLVLEYDEKANRALVISKYALDTQPYNTEWIDVTWETCTLRAWLNGTFINEAFSAEEQKAIPETEIDNGKSQGYSGYGTDGGKNTKDQIFLLSYAEANRYFGVEDWHVDGAEDNMRSRVSPTEYADKQGAWTNSSYTTEEGKAAACWWLRSPGGSASSAAVVYGNGALDGSYYVYGSLNVVRPAFWLDLTSDLF